MTIVSKLTTTERNDQQRNVYLAYTGNDENNNRYIVTTTQNLEDEQEISKENPIQDFGKITLCQLCYSTLGESSPNDPSFHDGEYKNLVLEVLDCSEDTARNVLEAHIENNPSYPDSQLSFTPREIISGV
jgi:hypothetical protein